MNDYEGVIIEESLEDKAVLARVKITATRVEKVVEAHRTPWLSQWTLHTVEIPEGEAQRIAEAISQSLDRAHSGAWYADFKNATQHYIIFPDRIFLIDRTSQAQYDEARRYGIALGIPDYQVDFHPDIDEWER